jgi:hypothetical protein
VTCAIVSFSIINNVGFWKAKRDVVIQHDIISYYAYLPGLFIYGDATLNDPNDKFTKFKGKKFYLSPNTDGYIVHKMSSGLAILYSPFFFMAHAYALMTHHPANGFSPPYSFAIQLAGLIYALIGLIFLRKVLLRYFSEKIIFFTLISIFICTNLLYYATLKAAYSHSFSFCLFCILLYTTPKWFARPDVKKSVVLGILIGLIALIRPTNVLIVFVFLLYNVSSKDDFKNRATLFLWKAPHLSLIMMVMAIFAWIPQMLYWHAVTGQYFYYSYSEEGFFWLDPKIIEGLFSFRKGLFIYSPILLLSLFGIFRTQCYKEWKWGIYIFFPVFIYVTFSWWCWWYGGGFGARPMVETFSLLALPLAGAIDYLLKKSRYTQIAFYFLFAFFIVLSSFQTAQAKWNMIHYDAMTFKAYRAIFFKVKHAPEKHLDHPDYKAAMRGDR